MKALCRKGEAFLALSMANQASTAFQEALRVDPFHLDSRRGLQSASQKMLEGVIRSVQQYNGDLNANAFGTGTTYLCLPPPTRFHSRHVCLCLPPPPPPPHHPTSQPTRVALPSNTTTHVSGILWSADPIHLTRSTISQWPGQGEAVSGGAPTSEAHHLPPSLGTYPSYQDRCKLAQNTTLRSPGRAQEHA